VYATKVVSKKKTIKTFRLEHDSNPWSCMPHVSPGLGFETGTYVMEDECNGKWDIDRLYCIVKLNKVNKIKEFQTENHFTQVSMVFVLVLFLFFCYFFFF